MQQPFYAGHWSSGTDFFESASLAVGATAALTFTGAVGVLVHAHLTTTAATAQIAYLSPSATFDTGQRSAGSGGIAFFNARISTDDPPPELYISHDSSFASDVVAVRYYSLRP